MSDWSFGSLLVPETDDAPSSRKSLKLGATYDHNDITTTIMFRDDGDVLMRLRYCLLTAVLHLEVPSAMQRANGRTMHHSNCFHPHPVMTHRLLYLKFSHMIDHQHSVSHYVVPGAYLQLLRRHRAMIEDKHVYTHPCIHLSLF